MTKLTAKIHTTYVTVQNHKHAAKMTKKFGSRSAYINHLVSKDRGVKSQTARSSK